MMMLTDRETINNTWRRRVNEPLKPRRPPTTRVMLPLYASHVTIIITVIIAIIITIIAIIIIFLFSL